MIDLLCPGCASVRITLTHLIHSFDTLLITGEVCEGGPGWESEHDWGPGKNVSKVRQCLVVISKLCVLVVSWRAWGGVL